MDISLKDRVKKVFDLPFGLVLGRKSSGSGEPLSITGKRAYTGSNEQEKASLPILSRAVKKKVSGVPDKTRGIEDINFQNIGGRKSVETQETWTGIDFWNSYATKKRTSKIGMSASFDIQDFESMDFDYLAELLSDLSPEISKALWDFLLMANSGYETKAYKPHSEDIDEAAQQALDEMLDKLGKYHGTLGVFFDRLYKMIFLRGSFLMELVVDENGYDFIDIATPDTKTLHFKRILDEKRGQVWTFGQKVRNQFISLDLPTIRYIPVHPSPDSIEGHSLCSAAFFSAIFLMSVLRDTKRVVQHQGYMRLDVSVKFDELKETMPEDIQGNPQKITEWMNKIIQAVEDVYSSLEPDDTYVHSSSIEINNPVGTISSDSLRAIDALFQALERMLVRALKTMPLLMASNSSRSETQANREWEIYAKGIESVQHLIETSFEYVLELGLQAQGYAVDVKHRFAQFRTAEKMRDAQVDFITDKIARFLYDCGIVGMDEMAQMSSANKQQSDMPEPRDVIGSVGLPNQMQANPNPGEGRNLSMTQIRQLFDFLNDPNPDDMNQVVGIFESIHPTMFEELRGFGKQEKVKESQDE